MLNPTLSATTAEISPIRRQAIAWESLTAVVGGAIGGQLLTNPSQYNTATADPTLVVGGLYEWVGDGYIYRYVQFKDAVTYAAGQSVEYAATTGLAVTNDRAGGSSVGRAAAGVCLGVMTQNYYGFILVQGTYNLATSGADDIAAGEILITHATTDGTVDGVSTWTLGCIGVALAADVDAADTVLAVVQCL